MRKVLRWSSLTVERQETTLAYLNACRVLQRAGALPKTVRKRNDDEAK
jgi:hypothetical protein